MKRLGRRVGAIAVLLAGVAGVVASPGWAQSARNREEKAQSKPSRSENRDDRDNRDNSRRDDSVYTVVPVIVGGGGSGGAGGGGVIYPAGGAPVYGGARYGNFPRIAFLSDRSGVPGVWMMYENGTDIHRITRGRNQAHDVAFSPDRGRLACTVSSPGGQAGRILLMNANGKSPKHVGNEAFARQIAWSPDDRFLVYTSDRTGNDEVYLTSADGKTVRRLTDHPARDTDPTFSGDGQSVVFVSDRDGKPALYRVRVDGSGQVERISPANAPAASSPACTTWSGAVAFVGQDPQDARRADVYLLYPDTGKLVRLTKDAGQNLHPTWDPAGGRLAFSSNRGGTFAIYTVPEAGGTPRQITFGTHNDTQPSWW